MGFIKRSEGKIINIFNEKDLDDKKKSSIKDSLKEIIKKSDSVEDNKELKESDNIGDN